jgi:hypothetical protein
MTTNPPSIANSATTDSVNAGAVTTTSEQTNKVISFKWLFAVLGSAALSLLAFYYFNFGYRLEMGFGSQADFGAFGDFLGGVLNPILGFATVALLIWSLKMQRDELALTRQELKETKQETALSRQAMQEQVVHFQQEAKLNELTRLLERSHKKYEVILDAKPPSVTIQKSQNTLTSLPDTYHQLLNDTILKIDVFFKEHNNRTLLNHPLIKKHVDILQKEAILIADLALKYYSINESVEFARAYLSDAYDKLQTLSQLYSDDSMQSRITDINFILTKIAPSEVA